MDSGFRAGSYTRATDRGNAASGPPRGSHPTPSALRAAGVAAVAAELEPRPIAEEVGRMLRARSGWRRFPREMISTEAGAY